MKQRRSLLLLMKAMNQMRSLLLKLRKQLSIIMNKLAWPTQHIHHKRNTPSIHSWTNTHPNSSSLNQTDTKLSTNTNSHLYTQSHPCTPHIPHPSTTTTTTSPSIHTGTRDPHTDTHYIGL
uniref:Uncharacterized protein n=1 Tax=Cacopsylla melanoneura TaxID=428564 RepID=A0A8D9ALG4_9HEMI